jgi:hypothetical protein
MACTLRSDATGKYDVLGAAGDTPIVFVSAPATARITAATLNASPLAVDVTGRASLTALNRGTNPLDLVVEGIQEGDLVMLAEACDDASTRDLHGKRAGAAPGGANPVMNFRIHVA